MRSFPIRIATVCLMAISLFMYGCGGGGGSSSDDGMDGMDGNGGGDTAMQCPAGQVGKYPDCMDPGPSAAELKAEAERIAGAIGPSSTRLDVDGTTEGLQMPFSVDGRMLTEAPATPASKDDDFSKAEKMPAGISRWQGAYYMRDTLKDDPSTPATDETTIDRVVFYTDQSDKTDAEYVAFMTGTVDTDHDGTADIQALAAAPDSATGVVALTDFDTIASPGVFGETDFGLTAPNQSGNPIAPDEEGGTVSTIEGTFYGLKGTFTCTGTCTATSDAMGKLNALGGTSWTFKPDALDGLSGTALTRAIANLKVPDVINDPDYMTFGYWLRQTEGKDGTVYGMNPFAQANRDFGSVTVVEGIATYEGSATGLYMKKTLTSEGDVTGPFESGQFTADVMLHASFGGTAVAEDKHDTITGSVTDFKDSGGNIINSNWALNLGTNQTPGTIADAAGTFSGVVKARALAGSDGEFSGTFHGPGSGADGNPQPMYATGIFDGHFTNGHVRGAFGTYKNKE